MSRSHHDTWAIRISEAITARRHPATTELADREAATAQAMLLALADEAAAVVGAIGRNVEAVAISGNHRHATLPGFLEAMMPHRDFSFLEYRYVLPEGEEPGLRFRVDLDAAPPCVEVYFFDDLRRGVLPGRLVASDRPDSAADRANSSAPAVSRPICFELEGPAPRPVPDAEFAWVFTTCVNWQEALRETLALPFRHLYDPVMTAC